MSEPGVLTIHIDGAARGNPGPAAFAFVIERNGEEPVEEKGTLGHTTNNVAEYTALVRALEHATQLGGRRLHIHSDSELLVKQMNGEYQVKNDQLRSLFKKAKIIADHFDSVTIGHIRREQNSRADRLCNEALDGQEGGKKPSPTPAKKTVPHLTQERKDSVRDEGVLCLKSAAQEWARGNALVPSPEQVWDQLWSILEEAGVVRMKRAR
jgi:ribonuclease HI